jgi:hypothetical protein
MFVAVAVAAALILLLYACSGAVCNSNSLQLADVLRDAAAAKVWVLADEIYERIVYDTEHYSFANIPGKYCYDHCSPTLAQAQALITEPVRPMLKLTIYYEVALSSILMRCTVCDPVAVVKKPLIMRNIKHCLLL